MIPVLIQHDAQRVVGTFDPATCEVTFRDDARIPFHWMPGAAWIVLEWFDNPVHAERYIRRARLLALSVDPDAPPAARVKL